MTESDRWLTPAEAAQHCGLSYDNFLRRVRAGIGPERVGDGRLQRFKRSACDRWVASGFKPVVVEDA